MGAQAKIKRVPHRGAKREEKQEIRREETKKAECDNIATHGMSPHIAPGERDYFGTLYLICFLPSQTRNPAKYNKNAARNRLRAIETERRKIQSNAVFMAQRLAAVHDPSGAMFNVKPVTILEDGRVVTLESIEKKKEKEALKEAEQGAGAGATSSDEGVGSQDAADKAIALQSIGSSVTDRLNPDRMAMLIESKMPQKRPNGLSKTQQKKMAQYEPRPPPPKPTIPEGIAIPEDELENWIDLWDLPDGELERRVMRAKKTAAKERKELRLKQKSGKAERRAARDEKRRVYRDVKQTWKVLREAERRRKKYLIGLEDEERKKLALEVSKKNRQDALRVCEELGFTLQNVEGVTEIQPKTLGTKGMDVDFSKLEFVGNSASGLRVIGKEQEVDKPKSKRIDLGAIAPEEATQNVYGPYNTSGDPASMNQNFVEFGNEGGQEYHGEINYNHKVRRKLRRAMESAQIKKEQLVREAAIKYCEENNIEVSPVLRTLAKPESIKGQRTMPDGTLESSKQERVRSRVELVEFNKNAKVLRRQAKDMAVEAGIRIYLELIGRIPKREGLEDEPAIRAATRMISENGEHVMWTGSGMEAAGDSMADILASWPMPEDEHAAYEGMKIYGDGQMDGSFDESSEDSAAKQLKAEMADAQANGRAKDSSSEEDSESEDEDSDIEMSDAT